MTPNKLTLQDLRHDEPLPEILQALWAKDQVMQLFADLAEGADVRHVRLKSTTTDASVTLDHAAATFAAGDAQVIQVRYVFADEMWCDTILPGDPTTRIIRNRMPV